MTEVCLEPYQTSKMELFMETVNAWKPFTVFAKSSILIFTSVLNTPLGELLLNSFSADIPFLYSIKTSQNQSFSDFLMDSRMEHWLEMG